MDTVRTHPAEEDLEFVRRALRRDAAVPFPKAIALLWAAISIVGFTLLDFAPSRALPFWAIAGPSGFLVTLWLSRRSARSAGEKDRAEANLWTAHWLGLLVAVGLVVLPSLSGKQGWESTGATIVLLLALVYYTAGIHLHRGLLPVAAILAGGYLLVLFVEGNTWTWLGFATATALAASAFVTGGKRRA